MSDIDAKLERSATGSDTGVSAAADTDEIDIALEGLDEADAAVPLPAPRAKEEEREIDVALDALGEEPTPSMVVEVDRALGALDPVPTAMTAGPVALPAPRARQEEHEVDLALDALGEEPAPSTVMEVDRALGALDPVPTAVTAGPVALPAPRARQEEQEVDLALDALGEEPTPSMVVEVDRALGALDPVPTAVTAGPVALPAPRARQEEQEVDLALDALGEEPTPSTVMEVDRALGALEPMPSVGMPLPSAPPPDQEMDLALEALEEAPEPSVAVELPEAVEAAPAPAGADDAEQALEGLGEAPEPSVAVELPEALEAAPVPAGADDAEWALEGLGEASAEHGPPAGGTTSELPENTSEMTASAEPVITSSESGTHGTEDMGAAQQLSQVSVGPGGGISPTPELLRSLVPGMVRAAAAILGTAHPDLDDVVQQSLIGFVQALPGFRGECGPARFASRIVARTACAARRRGALQASRRVDEVDVDALEAVSPSQPSALMAERRRAALRELLADIPEEQAETLSLRVVFGFSLEEVAETTGVPVNTVRSRVRLAKEALRSRIDERPALRELLEVES